MFDEVLPPQGKFYGPVFAFPVRVYYEDTDAGGIVYYANYLRFGFAVRHIDVDYKAPAVLDDALTVTCEVKEFGGASAVMFQQIWRGEKLLTELEVKVVYLSLNKKRPVRIPQELAAAIEKL